MGGVVGIRGVAAALALAFVLGPMGAATALAEGPATTWTDAGKGTATAFANVLYIPAKLGYSVAGGLVGGFAYLLTAGDVNVAQQIWEPSVGGDYTIPRDRLFPETAVAAAGESVEVAGSVGSDYDSQWPE